MDCREAMRRLSARMDGEAKRDPAVDAHVEGCANCQAADRSWQAVREHYQEIHSPTAPGDMAGRVAAAIRNRKSEILELKSLLRRTAAAAAVLLLASTAATFIFSPKSSPVADEVLHASAIDRVFNLIVEERLSTIPTKESDR